MIPHNYMKKTFEIHPIGVIRKATGRVDLEVLPEYHDALDGLEGFSHINVFYWFHRNDTAEKRRILKVHPRSDTANPLTGVFATHAPVRPNLIAFSLCRVLEITGGRIRLADIDALDGTPVIDIKCYIPPSVPAETVRLPDWV